MKLPPLFAVLVNPGAPLETKNVFARIGLSPGEPLGFGKHPDIAETPERDALFAALKRARNDLEDAATVLAPVIGHCLAVLSAARGVKLARMSGSGATCFALFETCRAAATTAKVIRRDHPEWWVKATVLR
jgi:4-diphosphocytidyl-2-C-methyl-D-erythritol kinase